MTSYYEIKYKRIQVSIDVKYNTYRASQNLIQNQKEEVSDVGLYLSQYRHLLAY